ncbi:hypothetical protein PAPHI01_0314 [Pancytospora philotis]|nr:hypothetical protein PAPHI01_0314 [Pancytospora philotis]
MWARFCSLLICVNCGQKHRTAVARALGPAYGGYPDSEKLGATGLNEIENLVLGALYRRCSEHDCPEIRRALFDRRLSSISACAKVRYVVYTLLGKAHRPALFERLLARFGYAGRLVLQKLFRGPSIASLTGKSVALDGAEPHRELRRATTHSHCALRRIYQCVQSRVVGESRKSLLQLAENGCGLDLASYVAKRMDTAEETTLSSAFITIMDVWSGGAGGRDRLLPVATEYLRIALQPKTFKKHLQADLRGAVVEYVFSKNQRAYFDLFRGFAHQRTTSSAVNAYIDTKLSGVVSLCFLRDYLDYMKKNYSYSDEGAYYFFRGLLEPPVAFHAPKTIWNSDPERFNLISPRWLREMLEDLRDNSAHRAGRRALMCKYMCWLRYEVFVCILRCYIIEECEEMAVFMLMHQSVEAREEYERCYRREDMVADRPHKKVLSVLANVFKRLAAHQPVLAAVD